MFVSFLLPLIDRGTGPLHHWVMLAQMARLAPDEIAFIGDAAYFEEDSVPFGETLQIGAMTFDCPSREAFSRYRKLTLDDHAIDDLYADGASHLDALKAALTRPERSLRDAVAQALDALGDVGIEAFLTWCNCPTLNELAAVRGIPVIHNELGPLRAPLYYDTFYFDFAGVNGDTTPSRWSDTSFLRQQLDGFDPFDEERLRGHLVRDIGRVTEQLASSPASRFELGVALQVQDDSNAVAFNHEWDEIRLLYDALTRHAPDRVLIRSHPLAPLQYRGGLGTPDDSRDALAFLARCNRVVSVNSSVLAEAALWGVPFDAKGDTPFACLGAAGTAHATVGEERRLWLNALFLAYLVPGALLFDPDYYRWRLARQRSLAECAQRHVEIQVSTEQSRWPTLSAAAAEAGGTQRTRLPATWTRGLSLQVRLRKAEAALAARVGLEEEAGRWRVEAEKVWNEREWLKGHVDALEKSLTEVRSDADTREEHARRELAELQAESQQARRELAELRTESQQTNEAVRLREEHARRELAELRTESQQTNEAVRLREEHARRELALVGAELQRMNEEYEAVRAREEGAQHQLAQLRARRLSLGERLRGRLGRDS